MLITILRNVLRHSVTNKYTLYSTETRSGDLESSRNQNPVKNGVCLHNFNNFAKASLSITID